MRHRRPVRFRYVFSLGFETPRAVGSDFPEAGAARKLYPRRVLEGAGFILDDDRAAHAVGIDKEAGLTVVRHVPRPRGWRREVRTHGVARAGERRRSAAGHGLDTQCPCAIRGDLKRNWTLHDQRSLTLVRANSAGQI